MCLGVGVEGLCNSVYCDICLVVFTLAAVHEFTENITIDQIRDHARWM